MSDDSEIEAMQRIAAALEPLDDNARNRALQWAFSRFSAKGFSVPPNPQHRTQTASFATQLSETPAFETFADLFEAATPNTESEKALIASYWIQVCQGQSTFGSQTLNSELKDLGHGVGNITEALTALKNEKPALVLQIKKSGTSRQARKTYKLTQEGIRRVQTMIRADASTNYAPQAID